MNKRRSYRKQVLFLTRGALIAALYVTLTEVSFMLGLSSGVIQFRISEMLCILPLFMPEAIFGVTVGCFLSNLITGCVPWDIFAGTLATLLGALCTYLFKGLPYKFKWVASIPPVLTNALIVPFVLIYAYGSSDGYFFILATVTIGEVVCAGVCGSLLYYSLSKTKLFK